MEKKSMIIIQDNIKEGCFVKKFISKKNDVSLYQIAESEGERRYVVIKKFVNSDAYKNELRIYRHLISCCDESELLLNYPKLLGYDDSRLLLVLDYIVGDNVLDKLQYYESINCINEISHILIGVLEWLKQFYSAIGVRGDEVFGDVNLRNFIITKNGVYGIDFEDVKSGIRKSEMIEVLAFYMLCDPIKSDVKKKVVSLLYKEYQELESDVFLSLLGDEMKRIQLRRNNLRTSKLLVL